MSQAIKNILYKKYKWESCTFLIAVFGVFYVEFLPFIHCPSIWNNETCIKINSITSQLLLAYIASYMFFYLNIYRKERNKYKNYYPQIIEILKNLFSVFDSQTKYLASVYKRTSEGKEFIYEDKTIQLIIEHLRSRDESFIENYKTANDKDLPSSIIGKRNHFTAAQIYFDIDLLNRFDDVFDSDYQMILLRILINKYIIFYKDNKESRLEFYGTLVESEILLYKEINKLRIHSTSMFGVDF